MIAYYAELIFLLQLTLCFATMIIAYRYAGHIGLISYIVVAVIFANLQVLKLGNYSFFSTPVALGTILFCTVFTANDILVEKYGFAKAKKSIFLSFLLYGFGTLTMLFTLYHPGPSQPEANNAIRMLFEPGMRIFIASIIALVVGQYCDIFLYNYFKKKHHQRLLWLRANFSTILAGIVDTSVFSFLAWYILDPEPKSLELILQGYIGFTQITRIIVAISSTPIIYYLRKTQPYV